MQKDSHRRRRTALGIAVSATYVLLVLAGGGQARAQQTGQVGSAGGPAQSTTTARDSTKKQRGGGGGTVSPQVCPQSVSPGTVTTQTICPPPGGDNIEPTVTITPGSGSVSSGTVSVTVDWCDDVNLSSTTRSLRLNGQSVSIGYTTSSAAGCGAHARSTATLTLVPGNNLVEASISDGSGNQGYNSVTYTAAPQTYLIVNTDATTNGNQDMGLCATRCFGATQSVSTVPYYSLDTPRNVTLVYHSDRVVPQSFIYADVSLAAGAPIVQQFWLEAQVNGAPVTFTNGEQRLHFQGSAQPVRLAGQFDASGFATKAYPLRIIVTAQYAISTEQWVDSTHAILIVNESKSPVARGWTVAGVPRIYDAPGVATSVVEGDGSAKMYPLDYCAGTCFYKTPAGSFTRLTWNEGGTGKFRRYFPDSSVEVYSETIGLLESRTDRFGNAVVFQYDASQRLVRIYDPVRTRPCAAPCSPTPTYITLNYGAYGLQQVVEPSASGTPGGGRTTTFVVNTDSTLTTVTDPDGVNTSFAYDGSRRLQSVTDRRGGVTTYTYDGESGKLARTDLPTIRVDTGGTTTAPVRPSVTYSAWQGVGVPRTATTTSPAAAVRPADVRATITDPRQRTTGLAVDRWGAASRIDEPTGRWTTVVRNLSAQVTEIVSSRDTAAHDPTFRDTTRYAWSGPNLVLQVRPLTKDSVSIEYDTKFNLPSHASGTVQEVWNYYGGRGTLDSTRAGFSYRKARKFYYDALGRDTLSVDELLHTERRRYGNLFGNLDTVTADGARRASFGYDGYGRVTAFRDQLGQRDSAEYDALNRILRRITAAGEVTSYAYDSLYLRSVADGKGQVITYARNALGWVEGVTDASSVQQSYTYDLDQRLASWTNRRGQLTRVRYDLWGRPISRTLADGRTTTVRYDPKNLYVVASNEESVDSAWVDAEHRYSGVARWRSGRQLYSSTEELDAGRRVSLRISGDTATVGGVLTTKWTSDRYWQYSGTDPVVLTFDDWRAPNNTGSYTRVSYNDDLQPTKYQLPTGDTISLAYGPTHALSSITYNRSSSNRAGGQLYTLDALTRLTERHNVTADSVTTYGYTAGGQLQAVSKYVVTPEACVSDPSYVDGVRCVQGSRQLIGSQTFTYDAVGNPPNAGAPSDAADRVHSINGFTLEYDADGNIVHKYKTGVIDQRLYWNSINQLDSVTTNGATVRFGYDASGLRVRKTTSAGTTRYFYDGTQLVIETDASGNLAYAYRYRPDSDVPHRLEVGARPAERFYYLTDRIGSVLGLMDSTGAVLDRYSYAPFGAVESVSETVPNSLRFAGRPYDVETGLYYNTARFYDPDLQRFLSEDPIGFVGGINPYVYADNDPVNLIDPSGLAGCRPVYSQRGNSIRNGSGNRLDTQVITGTIDHWECDFGDGGTQHREDGARVDDRPWYGKLIEPDPASAAVEPRGKTFHPEDDKCTAAVLVVGVEAMADVLTFGPLAVVGAELRAARVARAGVMFAGESFSRYAATHAAESAALAKLGTTATWNPVAFGTMTRNGSAMANWSLKKNWTDLGRFIPLVATGMAVNDAVKACFY